MSTNPHLSFNFKTKLALLLASLFLFSNAYASNEHIEGVELFDCIEGFCVKLNTAKLYRSPAGKNYAFGASDIEIIYQGTLEKKTFQGFEGSFDARSGRFYLSKNGFDKEYMIDTREKSVSSFKAQ